MKEKLEDNQISRNKRIIKEIGGWIICIVIAVILALLIKYFILTPTVVKQESMYPTLEENQRLILNRLGRTFKQMPKRGDIITFEAPTVTYRTEEDTDISNPVAIYEDEERNIFGNFSYNVLEIGKTSYIKRVIGLPGDHVQIKNGKVYINEEELEEDYLQPGIITDDAEGIFYDIIVPENTVFAMGDNRNSSVDCRAFGCIPLEKIEGKVLEKFRPLNKFGFKPEEVEAFVRAISGFSGIRVRGLMTSAPYVENPEDNRCYFRQLKQLCVDINAKNIDNINMDVLSMGMTNDYVIAVEEGATHIRVGTAIFGHRDYGNA